MKNVAAKKMGMDPAKCIAKFNSIKGLRGNTEQVWQEIADYVIPRKNDITVQRSPGEKKYVNLLDSTAMVSNELLAGALHGMLTNPAGYFFNLSTGSPELDARDAVRLWLQTVVRKMHDRLNNTNFQTEVHESYLDICAFGTACMIAEEDADTLIRFSTRSLREVYFEENSRGYIDTVYRSYCMDARGIVDDFGFDNVPKKIQDAYKANKPDKFDILHVVYPRKKEKIDKKYNRFNYVSQYILMSEKVDLEVEGFNESPYLTPRWSKASGEVYGRGCGEKALPSAKTVNKMRETTLRGAQKVVDPPLQAPDDGFVIPLDTRPAGLNYYRAGSQDRIQPIFNDARIDFGFQAIDQERIAIREAFYTDQLKLREGPQMTATEVSERVEQALRFLGPMLGRQQSEFLQPLVERLYAVMDRAGEIPEAPAELQGVPLKIQYSSVMAMQQRMSEVQNIQRTMQNIAPFASADPSVLDNFDGDVAAQYIARLFNFPQEILRTKEDLAAIRKQRADAQAAAQQAMQQKEGADAASKVVGAAAKLQKAG